MILTDDELYALTRLAGFPDNPPGTLYTPGPACKMTAIALRESAGDPNAYNGNRKTGDDSYGLWQINLGDIDVCITLSTVIPSCFTGQTFPRMIPDGVYTTVAAWPPGHGLFDPETNARAAFGLCRGGNEKLMDVAWYIDRTDTAYQERYLAMLPRAIAAAERYAMPATAGKLPIG